MRDPGVVPHTHTKQPAVSPLLNQQFLPKDKINLFPKDRSAIKNASCRRNKKEQEKVNSLGQRGRLGLSLSAGCCAWPWLSTTK